MTGLRLKLEGRLSWVLFPRSCEGLQYLQRYIGRAADSRLKVEGLIRSNMPVIVRSPTPTCSRRWLRRAAVTS